MPTLNIPRLGLYIDGLWVDPSGDDVEEIVNPATEMTIATYPVGTVADGERAIAAARTAFDDGPWSTMSGAERSRLMLRLHEILAAREQEIADLLVHEIGAVPAAALNHHVRLPLSRIPYYAELARRDWTKSMPVAVAPAGDSSWLGGSVVAREPAGVAALITPFNFPFYLNVGKLAPSLAAGCTVVLKPSPFTPLSAMVVAEAVEEADFPPGVINVVTGDIDVGRLLTTDPRVDLVSFTGSDAVGSTVMAQAAPTLKRVVLELGGKSALIVRSDADLAAASAMGLGHMITQAGQGCALCTRHLVHESVVDDYLSLLVAGANAVEVGDPSTPGTAMGPLIREQQRALRVEHFVQAGLDSGASVVAGGERPSGVNRGYFYRPTILSNLDNQSPVCKNEIFGPVAAVMTFRTDDEAVAIANDSDFGLSGAIYSADVGAAYQMARRIRTGRVDLNGGSGTGAPWDPFGGIKRSGMGREDGEEGLMEYFVTKTIRFHAG